MNKQTKHYVKRGPWTPWGYADEVITWDNGLKFYSTPSHGGFKVPEKLKKQLAHHDEKACASSDWSPWYEEDCEAIKIMLAFPECFKNELQPYDPEKLIESYVHWFNPDGTYRDRSIA